MDSTEDAWILATLPRAIAYARSLVGPGDADDLVHDCYCRLLAKRSTYNLPADGTRLLFRSLTRAAIDRHRRARPAVSIEGDVVVGIADVREARPDDAAIGREMADRIGQALGLLPLAQRAALELAALGYSRDELADALEVTPGHAGVLLHRARAALQNHLTNHRRE
ncbi:MAG: sigma-70 family RNA polymerase sigma factor [Gemmataceae bacterium]|nr:sigma-70 family RNA polymerase sigma factor [Gemmataceae bacterium]